jgi:hypothetical protein
MMPCALPDSPEILEQPRRHRRGAGGRSSFGRLRGMVLSLNHVAIVASTALPGHDVGALPLRVTLVEGVLTSYSAASWRGTERSLYLRFDDQIFGLRRSELPSAPVVPVAGPKPSACSWSVSGVAEEQDLIGHPGGMDDQMPSDATVGEERVEDCHLRSRHARLQFRQAMWSA